LQIFSNYIFWDRFRSTIPGHQDPNKPNEYHTADFGTVYRTTITSNLQDFLGGESTHSRDGNMLTFDKDLISAARTEVMNTLGIPNWTFYRYKTKIYKQSRKIWEQICKESLEYKALQTKKSLDFCIRSVKK
jgi:hypothetical protein